MTCSRCGAPMQALFSSLACSAECDLHEPPQPFKHTLTGACAVLLLREGKTLKCVACGCGQGCAGRVRLYPGQAGHTIIDDGYAWPWQTEVIESALKGVWYESGHFWEVV